MKKHLLLLAILSYSSMIFAQSKSVEFKKYTLCQFSIELPISFKLSKMFSDSPLKTCDYEVKLSDNFVVMELHSSEWGRFEETTISGFFNAAINKSDLNISYKLQSGNWFVISGTTKDGLNTVYWKRLFGTYFISDLYIEYPISRKAQIEQYIRKISKSFTCL